MSRSEQQLIIVGGIEGHFRCVRVILEV